VPAPTKPGILLFRDVLGSAPGTPDEAFSLLKEHPPDNMRMVQSGFEKRDMLEA
jgi:hypothetical protein